MRRCVLLLCVVGCGTETDAVDLGAVDLATGARDLATTPRDLTQSPDLAVAADLATSDDLASAADLAVEVDLAVIAPDLIALPDLAVAPDLTVAPDLSPPPDLAVPVDLATPPDLTPVPDLASPCGVCAAGRTCCGQTCVNAASDPAHCGGCGMKCAKDDVCGLGKCKRPGTVLFSVDGGSCGAPAVGADGTIYAVGLDGKLRAFDPMTGAVRWTSAVSTGAGRSYFYDIGGVAIGKHLYVGGTDGSLYAFDEQGALAWKTFVAAQNLAVATPAVGGQALGGAVVVAGNGPTLMAVNPDGTQKWKYTLGGNVLSASPALAPDGTAYIATWSDGQMYAVKADGTLRWKKSNGGGSVASPAIDAMGNVMSGNHGPADGIFYVFKPDGSILWQRPSGNIHGGCALARDGTVYVGNDTNVVAIRQDTTIKWTSQAVGGWVGGGILLTEDGMVHVPVSGNRTLVILEPAGGNILATVPLPGEPSPPTVGFHGALYVGTSTGKLVAYTGTSRQLDDTSPWPKHHRDLANTGRQ